MSGQVAGSSVEHWADLEMAPWRGLRLTHADVRDGLHDAAARDASIAIFSIRDGHVACDIPREDGLTPSQAPFVHRRAAVVRDFLHSVVAQDQLDCDLLLGVRLGDRGPEERATPVFCFHKLRHESNILLPDPDFLIHDFYGAASFRDEIPFVAKASEAMFVGATTGGMVTMERVRADAHERIRAARFFAGKPGVSFEISDVVQCDSEATRQEIERLVPRGRRTWPEQFACRYLLSMDGNGATWSRTAIILASASVLVKYASAYQLFYFRGLEPWVHYLPVRRDREVIDLIMGAHRTAERDAGIAVAGRDFADRHLTSDAVHGYMAALIRHYAAVVGGG